MRTPVKFVKEIAVAACKIDRSFDRFKEHLDGYAPLHVLRG